MKIAVVSIFPGMFDAIRDHGMSRRALEMGVLELDLFDPRDYTRDRYRRVDDRPYGGGPGMVMLPEPLHDALCDAKQAVPGKVIYLSPQGRKLDQELVCELAGLPNLVLLAGRYEGVDERVLQTHVDDEVSIGDYVMAGGELPAMVLIESLVRWLPGVLGNELSASQDSFSDGLLDCRHYTRPENWREQGVPEVLLSGDHDAIRRWRLKDALQRTRERRPDLLKARQLSAEEKALIETFKHEDDSE